MFLDTCAALSLESFPKGKTTFEYPVRFVRTLTENEEMRSLPPLPKRAAKQLALPVDNAVETEFQKIYNVSV